ncbi:hypothetical protein MKEN_00403300 [Mycena kentingensis (nom. inval.)]|nr:hypothetical protein MKEN_00403300 [Mycena kentingensis (nom. inval.)]
MAAPPPRTVPVSLDPAHHHAYTDFMVQLGLMRPTTTHTKRKRASTNVRKREPFDTMLAGARGLPRAGRPKPSLQLIMHYGPLSEWGPPTLPPGTSNNEQATISDMLSEEQRIDCETLFKIMMIGRPNLAPVIRQLYVDSELDPAPWDQLILKLSAAARDARTQDTNRWRNEVELIMAPSPMHLLLPRLSTDSKSDRGPSHSILGVEMLGCVKRALIEDVYYPQIDPNDSSKLLPKPASTKIICAKGLDIQRQLADGTFKYSPKVLPSAFWKGGACDPDNPEEGLFRSDSFVRAFRFEYLGKEATRNGMQGALPDARSVATLCGLYQVTPRMVGYVACQMRVMLSQYDWDHSGDDFDYDAMFEAILKLFNEEGMEEWARETLEFLQNAVFKGKITPPTPENDDDDDSEDELAAARRRRAAARAASTSESE